MKQVEGRALAGGPCSLLRAKEVDILTVVSWRPES